MSERICRRFALNFAEVNAKGLTLWSSKAFWWKQHVAIDSVVWYRSNQGPDACACERSFSQRVDSVVAEVCAWGLTLWSLIVARNSWSQCVAGGCLNVFIDNGGSRSSFVKGSVWYFQTLPCSSLLLLLLPDCLLCDCTQGCQARAISLMPAPEAFHLTHCWGPPKESSHRSACLSPLQQGSRA